MSLFLYFDIIWCNTLMNSSHKNQLCYLLLTILMERWVMFLSVQLSFEVQELSIVGKCDAI